MNKNAWSPFLIIEIVSICVGISCLVIVIIFIFRRRCKRRLTNKRQHGYDELDQEEIEFKRMIESHGGKGQTGNEDDFDDDLFFQDTSLDEFTLDSKDKNRLSMLDSFRNNLVAGAGDLNNNNNDNNVVLSDMEADVNDGDENMRL